MGNCRFQRKQRKNGRSPFVVVELTDKNIISVEYIHVDFKTKMITIIIEET